MRQRDRESHGPVELRPRSLRAPQFRARPPAVTTDYVPVRDRFESSTSGLRIRRCLGQAVVQPQVSRHAASLVHFSCSHRCSTTEYPPAAVEWDPVRCWFNCSLYPQNLGRTGRRTHRHGGSPDWTIARESSRGR